MEPPDTIFPRAYGVEEEKGIMTDHSGCMDEPYDLVRQIETFAPLAETSCNTFYENGFRIYPGRSPESKHLTNLEVVTPECRTPAEAVVYSRANDEITRKIVRDYAARTSKKLGREVHVRTQRRVCDPYGNRKACHDNYGLIDQIAYDDVLRRQFTLAIMGHLTTRSVVTGAGMVTADRFEFAQKVGGLKEIEAYGYAGSMFRLSGTEGTPRFEVRCSDVNISDWATHQRIAGVALVHALTATGLDEPLIWNDDAALSYARHTNRLRLTADGDPDFNDFHLDAIDFQHRLAELFLDTLPLETKAEIPDEYYKAALELYKFCDDFKAVTRGEQEIEILGDRADWAAKIALIRRSLKKDSHFGIHRTPTDVYAEATDLRYDLYQITGDAGIVRDVREGSGYLLRKKHLLANTVRDSDVTRATLKPPQTTRAKIRGEILRTHNVTVCDWGTLEVTDAFGDPVDIGLPDVGQTELSELESDNLESVIEILKRITATFEQ